MINKEELIKYLEEQMENYWNELYDCIYTTEEKENNTCNTKKCSGYGIGYVTKSDQSTCTRFTKQE